MRHSGSFGAALDTGLFRLTYQPTYTATHHLRGVTYVLVQYFCLLGFACTIPIVFNTLRNAQKCLYQPFVSCENGSARGTVLFLLGTVCPVPIVFNSLRIVKNALSQRFVPLISGPVRRISPAKPIPCLSAAAETTCMTARCRFLS